MNIVRSNLKLLWEHITFSRLTTFYFIFSILHCLIQVILQVQAFTSNARAATFLHSILMQGNATDTNGFTVLGENDLRMCDRVPNGFSTSTCRVIWNGTALTNDAAPSSSSASPAFQTALLPPNATSIAVPSSASSTSASTPMQLPSQNAATLSKPSIDDDDNYYMKGERDQIVATTVDDQIQVKVNGLGYDNQNVILDHACLAVLNYPVAMLSNTKREDVVFIAFQFWVLGMSIVAILYESIPHIVASLLTHTIATGWAAFQIAQTANFRADFSRLATNGACKPTNLLPKYWTTRRNLEISTLALNIAALLISTFLTWRLIKLFGWQTFKRVGASLTINRIYKLLLILLITIQLSLFFMVVSLGLWIDQLWNGQIAQLALLAFVYKPVFIVVLILLVPWLMTGWFGVRRELRIPMLIFLVLSFGYLVGWGAMFASTTFRWTFVQWRFFSLVISSSILLTLITIVLGLICRFNFGKGLLRYLSAQEPIPDETFSDPYPSQNGDYDPEKVDFPSHAVTIPTFSAAFGSGDEVRLPNQMFIGHQRGPRFYGQPTEAFDEQPHVQVAGLPTHGKSASSGSVDSEHSVARSSLARQDSQSSQRSTSSVESNTLLNSRRWVIE